MPGRLFTKCIDFLCVAFLLSATWLIYWPAFSTDYLYTDDALQLWLHNDNYNIMWIPQGRYLTYKFFSFLFRSIDSVHQMCYARLFVLAGWTCCLPAWYFIIKKIVMANGLPRTITFAVMVFMICMPPFALSVGWASCAELFLANTCGLLSGYALYTGLTATPKMRWQLPLAISVSLVFGVLSLFIYQNGFGCYFIPFFICLLAVKKCNRTICAALGFSLLLLAVYYFLFRMNLAYTGSMASDRSSLELNPFKKLIFFIARPLRDAFHLTWIAGDRSPAGNIAYIVLLGGCLFTIWRRHAEKRIVPVLVYLSCILVFLLFIYLPSLLTGEYYASNRTLFALDIAVCLLLLHTFFTNSGFAKRLYAGLAALTGFFLINAWYNFRYMFVVPVSAEYAAVKTDLIQHYSASIDTIYFIRPAEDAFESRWGITRSWDEFAVPSTAKKWVPEPLLRQLVFEITGNRQRAAEMIVQTWPDRASFLRSQMHAANNVLVIDAATLLAREQRGK